jgi:hypothetical protein
VRGRHVAFAVVIAALLVFLIVWLGLEKTTISSPSQPIISAVEKAGPPWAYPDPTRMPGSTNPDITQTNISETICSPDKPRPL